MSSVVGRRPEIRGEKGERAIWKFHLFPPANASRIRACIERAVAGYAAGLFRNERRKNWERKRRSFVSSGSFDLNPLEIRTIANNVRTGRK